MNDMVWCVDVVVVMDEVNLMVDNDAEEVVYLKGGLKEMN